MNRDALNVCSSGEFYVSNLNYNCIRIVYYYAVHVVARSTVIDIIIDI